jgi:hypothetical protein
MLSPIKRVRWLGGVFPFALAQPFRDLEEMIFKRG